MRHGQRSGHDVIDENDLELIVNPPGGTSVFPDLRISRSLNRCGGSIKYNMI